MVCYTAPTSVRGGAVRHELDTSRTRVGQQPGVSEATNQAWPGTCPACTAEWGSAGCPDLHTVAPPRPPQYDQRHRCRGPSSATGASSIQAHQGTTQCTLPHHHLLLLCPLRPPTGHLLGHTCHLPCSSPAHPAIAPSGSLPTLSMVAADRHPNSVCDP